MISVSKHADLTASERSVLEKHLAEYYSNPPGSYYTIANQAAGKYRPEVQPFHCDLVARVTAGMKVLELGCGSAHLCPFVEEAGGYYTGIDHSSELLKNNRERFPRARFFAIGTEVLDTFDIVASLYTIEHIVDSPSYLETMWNFCKPGALLAIICPDFVDGDGFPPSFYYGKTSQRFRTKIHSFSFADAFAHLFDLFWLVPRWKTYARSMSPGAFWINTKPRILYGADYSIDADAVHLPRLKDLVWWFEQRGASIVATSQSFLDIPAAILKHNCYVVARKPVEK
jgi:SAM-dependent methyltransferase